MDFTKKHSKNNGDVFVVTLDGWNHTGIGLAVYYDGEFYDTMVKEENMMSHEDWCITECVKDYHFIGENIEDLISLVL